MEHVKALLQVQVTRLLVHDPGTRLGTPEWVANVRSELAWLGNMLGPVRDLDVLLGHLGKECASLHFPERRAIERLLQALKRERAAARIILLQALESDRYLALIN